MMSKSFPGTVTLLLLLLVGAVWSGTLVGPIKEQSLQQAGYSSKHLREGEWYRLISSVFFVMGPTTLVVSGVMTASVVGWTEYRYGKRSSMRIFFFSHVATLLGMSLAFELLCWLYPSESNRQLLEILDVGPSAGYYGCLGFCIASMTKHRALLITAIGLILLARAGWSYQYFPESGSVFSADVSHGIAFPLGFLLGIAFQSRIPSCSKESGVQEPAKS